MQDVTDEARWRAVVDAVVGNVGRLDILVNSAGIGVKATSRLRRSPTAQGQRGQRGGHVPRLPRGGARDEDLGGGSIVNLSSVAGIIGDAPSLAYCASKGAVRLLTKSAALHCGRTGYNIRVNSVHPSFAETPMVQECIARTKNPERAREGLARAAPMGRMGKAEEVALTILFLASDESSFTTGGEFMVDGGLTAQ